WTIDEAPPPAGCKPAVGVEDTNNIRLLDVDHDNRTDVLHLSRYLDDPTPMTPMDDAIPMTALHLLMNRPEPRSPVADSPPLALPLADTWAYSSMDSDNDGRAELVHVGGAQLDTVRADMGSD